MISVIGIVIGIIMFVIGMNKQNLKSFKKVGLLIILIIIITNIGAHGSDFIRGFKDGFIEKWDESNNFL